MDAFKCADIYLLFYWGKELFSMLSYVQNLNIFERGKGQKKIKY